jgi:MYXO-CTERM domain-containing protein
MLARALFLVPLAAVLMPVGCSSAPPSPHNEGEGLPGEPTATTSEAITSDDAISRAMQWVTAKLQYCQSANGQPDGDTACSSVCNRESNPQWDPYRSDCSGFVSWAWGLAPPGHVTSTFAPFDTSVSNTIQASDLLPGDACNRNSGGHMVLFEKWITPGSQAVFMEEPGCSSSTPYAHEFTSDVTFNGVNIDIAYEGTTFTAIRFNQMTESPADAGTSSGSSGGDAGGSSGSSSGGSSSGGSGSSSGSSGSSTGSGSSSGTGGSSGSGSSGSSSSGSGGSSTGGSSGSGGVGHDAGAGNGAGASSGTGNGSSGGLQWNEGNAGSGCDVGAAPMREGWGAAGLVAIGLAFAGRRRARTSPRR